MEYSWATSECVQVSAYCRLLTYTYPIFVILGSLDMCRLVRWIQRVWDE